MNSIDFVQTAALNKASIIYIALGVLYIIMTVITMPETVTETQDKIWKPIFLVILYLGIAACYFSLSRDMKIGH